MTPHQFTETTRRMKRIRLGTPTSKAARKVLVGGIYQSQAAREEGVKPQTVDKAVQRILAARKKQLERE